MEGSSPSTLLIANPPNVVHHPAPYLAVPLEAAWCWPLKGHDEWGRSCWKPASLGSREALLGPQSCLQQSRAALISLVEFCRMENPLVSPLNERLDGCAH